MSENIKQIQGIKRAYEPNPSANNAGYQPVAKKKKGTYTSHALFNQPFLSFFRMLGVPVVGTTLREMIHTSIKAEPTVVDSRSRNCPYLDTINRYVPLIE